MMLRKTMIAAAIALCAQSGFAAAMPAQANASLMAELAHERAGKGLDSDHGFVISRQHPGQQDKVITRLNHTYKGIRIFESEAVVVSDNRGHIISQTMADRRGGIAKSGIANKKASISSQAAIDAAIRSVGGAGSHVSAPSAETIYYPVMKTQRVPAAANKAEDALNAMDLEDVVDGYRLAFLVETRMLRGGKPVYHNTIVDASNGAVLEQWSMVHNAATPAIGVGNSQYNGTVPVATSYTGTQYQMIDLTRGTGGTYGGMAITNANHGTTAGLVYVDPDNTWGDGQQYIAGGSTTNANGQTAAVNALWGLMNTYDTMKNVLGWRSLDGNNTATYIAVHVNTGYDNAYYTDTCKCMFIGDGGTYFNNLGSNDVIGHEMGHGVTAATSNLTYRGESGGLNESSSDINGEAVEAYARNGGTGTIVPEKNDWLVGAEIAKDGVPLRFFKKPSKDGSSPDAWSRKIRNLDVHYSSGPNNRMFYFLSEGSSANPADETYSQYLTKTPKAMAGIGIDKAYRIWFHANTTKFTSSTNYANARTLMQASAEELYGVGSAESKAVQRAYAAINVGSDITP